MTGEFYGANHKCRTSNMSGNYWLVFKCFTQHPCKRLNVSVNLINLPQYEISLMARN